MRSEEFELVKYIEDLGRKTFELFKHEIIKVNTNTKFIISYNNIGEFDIAYYSDNVLAINPYTIYTIGKEWNKIPSIVAIRTITINGVIHEMFHADQCIVHDMDILEASIIEDSVYDAAYKFCVEHYDYITNNLGPIDLGLLERNIINRNMTLYKNKVSPFNADYYVRIDGQLLIDNLISRCTSRKVFSEYMHYNPSYCFGIDFVLHDIQDNAITSYNLKTNYNEYNFANIQALQDYFGFTYVAYTEFDYKYKITINNGNLVLEYYIDMDKVIKHPVMFDE